MQFAIRSKYNLSAHHTNQFIVREVMKGDGVYYRNVARTVDFSPLLKNVSFGGKNTNCYTASSKLIDAY